MHQIIRAIVYAQDKEEALSKAKNIFDGMCGEENYPFDYSTTFDEEGSTVSGKGRWGNITPVTLATSKEGKKLIDDGMKFTKDGFMENIKNIRKLINKYSDDELFYEEVIDTKKKVVNKLEGNEGNDGLDMFKYDCYGIGQYKGSNIYLYDQDGEGIRDNKHLKDVLSKWECLYEKAGKTNPNRYENIYVVPADVHY